MRIDGVENKDINVITLKHSGKELNFQCFVKPVPYTPRTDLLKPTDKMTIVFDDILEIESMIDMLTRMKDMCINYVGTWNMKG